MHTNKTTAVVTNFLAVAAAAAGCIGGAATGSGTPGWGILGIAVQTLRAPVFSSTAATLAKGKWRSA